MIKKVSSLSIHEWVKIITQFFNKIGVEIKSINYDNANASIKAINENSEIINVLIEKINENQILTKVRISITGLDKSQEALFDDFLKKVRCGG